MSIYKKERFLANNMRLDKLSDTHASAINISFKTLGFNTHSSRTCVACQKEGKYFRSLVINKLHTEVLQNESTSINS